MIGRLLILLTLIIFVVGCEENQTNLPSEIIEFSNTTYKENNSIKINSVEVKSDIQIEETESNFESVKSESPKPVIREEQEEFLTEEEQAIVDKRTRENRIKFLKDGGYTDDEIEELLKLSETEEEIVTLREEPDGEIGALDPEETINEEIDEQFEEWNFHNTSIVIVMDISSTPTSSELYQKDQVIKLISSLNEKTNLGIISFNREAFEVTRILPLNENRAESIEKVSKLYFGGQSNFKEGIDAGVEMLMDVDGAKNIVYFSDGLTTYQKLIEDTKDSARNAAEKDIRIYVVGIGNSVNEEFLKDIAQLGNGTYFSDDPIEGLKTIFG